MAIQFNCPYCTASIRVPDSAAGKRGTCPKCGTKLIVPNVAPPPEAASADPPASPADPTHRPELQTAPPIITTETPSVARAVRRRSKKRNGIKVLIPILSFAVVLGLLAYWMWKPGDQLLGELTAERATGFPIPPVLVEKSAFGLPAEDAWDELKQHSPRGVLSKEGFQLLFEPDAQGLRIIIRATSKTEVVRVPTSRAPALRQHIKDNADEIVKQRQSEFHAASKKFLQDWRSSLEQDLPFETADYVSSLGFNRLAGITGYGVVAQIGQLSYRCVHEDDAGNLYFLLPKETTEFTLTGRELPSGETAFPGRYTVKISAPATEQEQAEPEESAPESPPQTEEELNHESHE